MAEAHPNYDSVALIDGVFYVIGREHHAVFRDKIPA